MKNSKKIVAIALALVMLVGGVIAGTMAWFTDDETNTTTVVVGNVNITLADTIESKQLMPATSTMTNHVGKTVTVKNDGTADENDSAAYVRLQVYVPANYAEYLHFDQPASCQWTAINTPSAKAAAKAATNVSFDIDKDGTAEECVRYTLYYTANDGILNVEETTGSAISGIYLDEQVDCDNATATTTYWYKGTALSELDDKGGLAEIKIVAEAIQTSGFVANGEKSAATVAWEAFDAQTVGGANWHAEAYQPEYNHYEDLT